MLSDKDVIDIINVGAQICKKLKVCTEGTEWTQVAGLFSRLKAVTRKLYPDVTELEYLKLLNAYSVQDLNDALGGKFDHSAKIY